MSWWDSYRAVYGAELRAAARELADHGWPVVGSSPGGLLLATGDVLDVLEVPVTLGRRICAQLRAADLAVPVAATPTGSWWFPISTGAHLPGELRQRPDVVLHTDGATVLAPPTEVADGFVQWRVAPALSAYRPAAAEPIVRAAAEAVRWLDDHDSRPGAQRPAAVAVGTRS